MHTIDIFLASSKELVDERRDFEIFISRHGNTWMDTRNTRLRLNIWENFCDAVSKTRKQDEYDGAIQKSQIIVMMFWTKVGMYTKEEFNVAFAQFQATGFPLIYTYFKELPPETSPEQSLLDFKAHLKELGHFVTTFKSTEELLLHFIMQFEKINLKIIGEPVPTGKTKADLISMVKKMQIAEVFEELNKKLGEDDLSLNTLIDEFVHPPDNFKPVKFAQQLQVFISRNY